MTVRRQRVARNPVSLLLQIYREGLQFHCFGRVARTLSVGGRPSIGISAFAMTRGTLNKRSAVSQRRRGRWWISPALVQMFQPEQGRNGSRTVRGFRCE
jgi:hypothetical protein